MAFSPQIFVLHGKCSVVYIWQNKVFVVDVPSEIHCVSPCVVEIVAAFRNRIGEAEASVVAGREGEKCSLPVRERAGIRIENCWDELIPDGVFERLKVFWIAVSRALIVRPLVLHQR